MQLQGSRLIFSAIIIERPQCAIGTNTLRVLCILLGLCNIFRQFHVCVQQLPVGNHSAAAVKYQLLQDFRHFCVISRVDDHSLNNLFADVVLNGFCRTLLLAFLLALQLIFLRDDEIKQGKVIHAADLLRLAG